MFHLWLNTNFARHNLLNCNNFINTHFIYCIDSCIIICWYHPYLVWMVCGICMDLYTGFVCVLIIIYWSVLVSNNHFKQACEWYKYYCIDNTINNVNDNNCKLCEYSAVGFVMDLHLTQWLDGGLCKEEKTVTKAVGLDHQTRRLYDTRSPTRSREIFC